MHRRLELRDLRSLERRSMYSIFRPLDSTERLPREAIVEQAQHRRLYMRDVDLGADLFLPALLVTFVVLASFGLELVVAFGLSLLVLAGVYALVASVRRGWGVRS